MALIETDLVRRAATGNDTALRDWVRALEATAPIGVNPQRLLPHVIKELAQTQGHAPALLSAGESLTYRALAERGPTVSRAGRSIRASPRATSFA
jgi:hypothetical protein